MNKITYNLKLIFIRCWFCERFVQIPRDPERCMTCPFCQAAIVMTLTPYQSQVKDSAKIEHNSTSDMS